MLMQRGLWYLAGILFTVVTGGVLWNLKDPLSGANKRSLSLAVFAILIIGTAAIRQPLRDAANSAAVTLLIGLLPDMLAYVLSSAGIVDGPGVSQSRFPIFASVAATRSVLATLVIEAAGALLSGVLAGIVGAIIGTVFNQLSVFMRRRAG